MTYNFILKKTPFLILFLLVCPSVLLKDYIFMSPNILAPSPVHPETLHALPTLPLAQVCPGAESTRNLYHTCPANNIDD
jgi:hypothetical protein